MFCIRFIVLFCHYKCVEVTKASEFSITVESRGCRRGKEATSGRWSKSAGNPAGGQQEMQVNFPRRLLLKDLNDFFFFFFLRFLPSWFVSVSSSLD